MTEVKTFTAGRRLKIHPGWREPGEPVPEAHTWMRMYDWLHSGYLKEATVSEADFRAQVEQYVPENEHQFLYEKVGLADDVLLHGPMATPSRRAGSPVPAPQALKPKAKPVA